MASKVTSTHSDSMASNTINASESSTEKNLNDKWKWLLSSDMMAQRVYKWVAQSANTYDSIQN